jgi:hypothetical protein
MSSIRGSTRKESNWAMRDFFCVRIMFRRAYPIDFPSVLQFIQGFHTGLSELPNSD